MERRKRTMLIFRVLAGCGALILLVVLVRGTMQQKKFEYDVCMDFQGHQHCATARGMTADEAIRSAQEIDCNRLAGDRNSNMVCLAKAPSSVQRVDTSGN
jgi:hypothetical protein